MSTSATHPAFAVTLSNLRRHRNRIETITDDYLQIENLWQELKLGRYNIVDCNIEKRRTKNRSFKYAFSSGRDEEINEFGMIDFLEKLV